MGMCLSLPLVALGVLVLVMARRRQAPQRGRLDGERAAAQEG